MRAVLQAVQARRSCRRRQILPGRLLDLNHKKAKLRAGTPGECSGIAMRIYGPNGATLSSPAANARRTSSSGFALPDTVSTPETRSATAPKAAGNIDALLAMQGIEDPAERRKRSVQRGRGALDVLDDLKIGLLSGNFDASTVTRLPDSGNAHQFSIPDPGLHGVVSPK